MMWYFLLESIHNELSKFRRQFTTYIQATYTTLLPEPAIPPPPFPLLHSTSSRSSTPLGRLAEDVLVGELVDGHLVLLQEGLALLGVLHTIRISAPTYVHRTQRIIR